MSTYFTYGLHNVLGIFHLQKLWAPFGDGRLVILILNEPQVQPSDLCVFLASATLVSCASRLWRLNPFLLFSCCAALDVECAGMEVFAHVSRARKWANPIFWYAQSTRIHALPPTCAFAIPETRSQIYVDLRSVRMCLRAHISKFVS